MDKNQNIKNKQRLSADGNRCSLLPSALRPRLLGAAVILQIVAMSTIFAFPCSTSATSLQMTLPSKISLNANPYNNSGFSENNPVDININTDSKRGYVFSIKSKDDNYLKNGDYRLNPITQSYATGEEFRDSAEPDTWGIKLSKWNSQDNDKYTPLPDGEAVIDQVLDMSGNSKHVYQLALATKISPETPAGEYANTFVLSAMSNTTHYSIVYDLNTGKGGPASIYQDGDTAEDTVQLDGGTPTRDGYEFLGWCDEDTIDSFCSGNIYQPGDSFPKNGTLASIDEKVILRAIWELKEPSLQHWAGCSSLSREETVTLVDTRDHNYYTVAKLKDGKCWMTQNLRIGKSDQTMLLNQEDSDLGDSFTLPMSDKFKPFDTDSETRMYIDNNLDYGGYYNWYTATGGDGISSASTVNHSICPKGWRLPLQADADLLMKYYDSNTIVNSIPNFKPAGLCWSNENCSRVGNTQGRWWTATKNNSLGENLKAVGDDPRYGFNIRCIER